MRDDERNMRYELTILYSDLARVRHLKDAQAAHDQTVEQAALDLEARCETIRVEYDKRTQEIYQDFANS